MAGRATVTTEPSMKAMLEPRMVAANTHGRARSAQPDVAAAAWRMASSQGARPKLIIGGLVLNFPSSHSDTMQLHAAHPEVRARIRVLRDPIRPHRPPPHRYFAGSPGVPYPATRL